jgi:hypothetical protein
VLSKLSISCLQVATAPDDAESVPEDLSCERCGNDDREAEMLVCEGCNRGFHMSCVGLSAVPAEDYFCSACDETQPGLFADDGLDDAALLAMEIPSRGAAAAGTSAEGGEAETAAEGGGADFDIDAELEIEAQIEAEAVAERRAAAAQEPPAADPMSGEEGDGRLIPTVLGKRQRRVLQDDDEDDLRQSLREHAEACDADVLSGDELIVRTTTSAVHIHYCDPQSSLCSTQHTCTHTHMMALPVCPVLPNSIYPLEAG